MSLRTGFVDRLFRSHCRHGNRLITTQLIDIAAKYGKYHLRQLVLGNGARCMLSLVHQVMVAVPEPKSGRCGRRFKKGNQTTLVRLVSLRSPPRNRLSS